MLKYNLVISSTSTHLLFWAFQICIFKLF